MSDQIEPTQADPRDDFNHPDHDAVCGWCGGSHQALDQKEQELTALRRILYLAECYLRMFDVVGPADKQTSVDRERLGDAIIALKDQSR